MGHRLRQCRKALGLSVVDVAAVLRVDKQTVYRWEWERIEPTREQLITLRWLFRCSLDWLVCGEGRAPDYVEASLEARGGDVQCLTE